MLFAILPALQAQACPADAARPIVSLSDLPKDVLSLLGRFEKPQPAIAEQIEFQDTWRGWAKTKGGYDTYVIKPALVLAPRP